MLQGMRQQQAGHILHGQAPIRLPQQVLTNSLAAWTATGYHPARLSDGPGAHLEVLPRRKGRPLAVASRVANEVDQHGDGTDRGAEHRGAASERCQGKECDNPSHAGGLLQPQARRALALGFVFRFAAVLLFC